MAGILIPGGILMAAMLAVPPIATAGEGPALRYELAFHMQGEALGTIEVRVTARTDAGGLVDFSIPARQTADVHAEQGTLDTSTPGHWILRAAPRTDVVLAWHSQPAAPSRTLTWDLWQSVLVRPDAMAASTNVLFAIPEGLGNRPVEVHWKAPDGWTVSTSLVQGIQSGEKLEGGTFMAGRHVRTSTRRAGDARITIAALESTRDVERIATDVARAVAEVTPPAWRHDYTLNIVDLDGREPGASTNMSSSGGTAYLMAGAPDDAWLPWLMTAAALPGNTEVDPSVVWYTQGFRAFRTTHALFAKGYLPAAAFAYLLNQATVSYGNSPFRRAPQSQVLQEYATSRDMRALATGRGALFAWLLDAHIRAATGGKKSLDDALVRMDSQVDHPGTALVEAVAGTGAGDITPLYRRYIVDGALLQLPRDALGPCFTIGTVADWSGWQVQHVFAKPSCPRRARNAP